MGSLGINEGLFGARALALDAQLCEDQAIPVEELDADVVAERAAVVAPYEEATFVDARALGFGLVNTRSFAGRFGNAAALMAAVPALPQTQDSPAESQLTVPEGFLFGALLLIAFLALCRSIMDSVKPEEYARLLEDYEADSEPTPTPEPVEVAQEISPRT